MQIDANKTGCDCGYRGSAKEVDEHIAETNKDIRDAGWVEYKEDFFQKLDDGTYTWE